MELALSSDQTKTILLAEPRGFCAGVDRAVRIVEVALAQFGKPVYVRHEIVHNKHVVSRLAAMGAVFVDSLKMIPDKSVVVFSAHGVAKAVVSEAERREMVIIDATCPLVTKVHVESHRQHRRGAHILLIGHRGHPEVEGTMGQVSDGSMTLIETIEDARKVTLPKGSSVAYATQTTLSVDDTAEIVAELKLRFPDIETPRGDDICYATTNRQLAVKGLAAKSDLVLVIGAENSSNSQRLVEVALKSGVTKAQLIASADEITWELVEASSTIGITAGASAPEILVEEVLLALAERYQIRVDRHKAADETIAFNLPPILRD